MSNESKFKIEEITEDIEVSKKFTIDWKKTKRFLKNAINPKNWYYFVQGHYRKIKGIPVDIEFKKLKCPDCWEKGECVECGCPILEMFLSDKPCPKKRF